MKDQSLLSLTIMITDIRLWIFQRRNLNFQDQ